MASLLALLALGSLVFGVAAAAAGAAEGIYLSWNDCPLAPSASQNRINACNQNLGQSELLCAFSLAQPIDSVLAIEVIVDVQHSATVLPPWWQFNDGSCRERSATADADFGARIACEDMWGDAKPAGSLQQYIVGQPGGNPNQARMRIAIATTSEHMRTLGAASTYYAARIVINETATVPPKECSGCSEQACLVLNAIVIGRPPRPLGAPSGNVVLDVPGPGNGNWATWQGNGVDCTTVPVTRKTWGQVKSLYR
jgi:hypothetical protein